jgi:hypothetical protein
MGAAAEPVASLQHDHVEPRRDEMPPGTDPGGTGADHDDVATA